MNEVVLNAFPEVERLHGERTLREVVVYHDGDVVVLRALLDVHVETAEVVHLVMPAAHRVRIGLNESLLGSSASFGTVPKPDEFHYTRI